MVSLGSYLLGAAELAAVAALARVQRLPAARRASCPAGTGAPARLVEIIVAVALLTWISEVLGTFGLFYAGRPGCRSPDRALIALSPAGGGGAGVPRGAEAPPAPSTVGDAAPTGPAGQSAWSLVVMVAVIASSSSTGR